MQRTPARLWRFEQRDFIALNTHRPSKKRTFQVNYWHQFEKGLLLRESVLNLVRAADIVADKPGAFLTVADLRSSWEVHGFHRWLVRS